MARWHHVLVAMASSERGDYGYNRRPEGSRAARLDRPVGERGLGPARRPDARLVPLSIMVESTFAAWWPLWLLPVLWLFHFLFNTATVHNLVIAVIAAVGPILTHHAFFSASGGQTSRVG